MKSKLKRFSEIRALRAAHGDGSTTAKPKPKAVAEIVTVPSVPLTAKQSNLLAKLHEVQQFVGTHVFERDRETEGIIVAILSGTSTLFIGAPGAGKTFHTRLISQLFGLSVFDTLMSETTKPDSIFGPTDVPALAKGVQRTKIKGYAPDSEILFFDEIFKASGIVLNPLLWLINEHEYRNGDDGIIQCPTKAVIAASNELPTEESLAAMYDRFLLRYHVSYLRNRSSLNGMLEKKKVENAPSLTSKDIDELRELVHDVVVPDDIRDSIYTLRDLLLRSVDIRVSDRRLVQSFKIIRARALLQGRMVVQKEDLDILANVFWERLDQVSRVRSVVLSTCNSKLSDIIAYEEIADDVWQQALKSGDLTVAMNKLDDMLKNAMRFTSEEGKGIVKMLQDYKERAQKLLDQRSEFTVLVMTGANGEVWFQVGRGTEGLWSPQQLRSVKFRHFRKSNYWWQEGYSSKTPIKKRKAIRIALRKSIEDKLQVKVQFNRM